MLGVAKGLEIIDVIPDKMDEIPDEQEESDALDQEIVLEIEEDQYVEAEDPYNGENLPDTLTLGDNTQEDIYSLRINMITFINEPQDSRYNS